jgi:hypothetical protein
VSTRYFPFCPGKDILSLRPAVRLNMHILRASLQHLMSRNTIFAALFRSLLCLGIHRLHVLDESSACPVAHHTLLNIPQQHLPCVIRIPAVRNMPSEPQHNKASGPMARIYQLPLENPDGTTHVLLNFRAGLKQRLSLGPVMSALLMNSRKILKHSQCPCNQQQETLSKCNAYRASHTLHMLSDSFR